MRGPERRPCSNGLEANLFVLVCPQHSPQYSVGARSFRDTE